MYVSPTWGLQEERGPGVVTVLTIDHSRGRQELFMSDTGVLCLVVNLSPSWNAGHQSVDWRLLGLLECYHTLALSLETEGTVIL